MKTYLKLISLALFAIGLAASCIKEPKPVKVSSVTVSPASAEIVEGESVTLKAAVSPSDAEYSGITWSSSNSSVAMVGSDGTVLAVSPGTATVTASTGGVTGSASITVVAKIINVTGVSLDKSTLTLAEGDEEQLTATIAPEKATNKNVTWKSSNTSVVTVSSEGKVTAVKVGTATITVTAEDGGKTATCTVAVLENIEDALTGLFSVSDTKQVRFSKGNLQVLFKYSHISRNTYDFSFADHQYDYVGNAPGNTNFGSKTSGSYLIDLFGWSTASTYYGINTSRDSADYSEDFVDWGNKIGDGSTWRTLSKDEWVYLFKTRPNASSLCRTGVTVCGKDCCLIIAPDGFTGTIAASYDASSWPVAEAAGLVCLPAAGCRYGYEVRDSSRIGYYWSSSMYDMYGAYQLIFISLNIYPYGNSRHCGCSVRLVTDVK